jgi:hypothetical protein
MTAQIPLEVAALVSFLMACTYYSGKIVERQKAARRTRTATATRYRTQGEPTR